MASAIDEAVTLILAILSENSGKPMRPIEVVSEVRNREPKFKSDDVPVRLALWNLLDHHRVSLTDDHRVIQVTEAVPA